MSVSDHSNTVYLYLLYRHLFYRAPQRQSSDVLSDIDDMLQGLTDELDAMLQEETAGWNLATSDFPSDQSSLPCAYCRHCSNHAQCFCIQGQSQISLKKYFVTQPAHPYHLLLSFFPRNVQMCILYVAGLELPVSDFVPSGMLEHRLARTIVILHGKLRVTVNSCEFIMWMGFKPHLDAVFLCVSVV